MQLTHFRFPAHKSSRAETYKYSSFLNCRKLHLLQFSTCAFHVCLWMIDCGHFFFLLASQDLTDCRVLPFLADDLLPVEEACVQVKSDFTSPAGCSKCSQASREELSQTLNMSACAMCSGMNPRLPQYLTALSACLCCFCHDRISAVSCSFVPSGLLL